MRGSKLFKKTMLGQISIFAIIAIATSLLSAWNLDQHLKREYVSKGTSIARSIASSSVDLMVNSDPSAIQAAIDQFISADDGIAYVVVVDDRHAVVAHTFVPNVPAEIMEITGLKEDKETITRRDLQVAEVGGIINLTAPILAGVAGYVHVGMDHDLIVSNIRAALIRQFALIAVIFGLSLAVVYVWVSRITAPLARLTAAATDVAEGDLERKVEIRSRDELGALARAFNHMIDRLRTSRDAEAQALARESALRQAEVEALTRLEQTVARYLRFVQQVAEGDLAQRLDVQHEGALGQLGNGLNAMADSLHNITTQVQRANANIASASAEILAVTTQQAASAAEQSAALTQTAATIEEVKVIAQQTSKEASVVAHDNQSLLEAAREGSRAVEDTVGGMQDIRGRVESIAATILALSEQTQAIGSIITTVSEIADQSNLLALNAAIEAARAGEQGKSFAIVAQHVRELAVRSKAATTQVREILDEIQQATNAAVLVTEEGTKGVEAGSRMAAQAGKVIQRITGEVEGGAQANIQMAAAAQQQMAGMEQIGQAMTSIQLATAQTLDGTRQAERAANDLYTLAQELQKATARYRLMSVDARKS